MSVKITFDFSTIENSIKEKKRQLQNCEVLIIENIPSAKEGFDLITKTFFTPRFIKYPKLLGIILSLNQEVKDVSLDDFIKLKSPLLVAIQSTLNNHESKTIWKVGENSIYELIIEDDLSKNLTPYIHEFLIKEIKNGRTGIHKNFQQMRASKVRLSQICENEDSNLLRHAVLSMNTAIVKQLLLKDFDPDLVIDLAWKKFVDSNDDNQKSEYIKIVYELLKGNSKFPYNFDYQKSSNEIQKFVDMCEKLHEAVKQGKLKPLKEAKKAEPNLVCFFNRKNQSLFCNCLYYNKKFAIENWSFFINNGFGIGKHERLETPYEELEKSEHMMLREKQKEIREEQTKNSLVYSEVHLFNLILKSRIGRNSEIFTIKHHKHICEAFLTLNKIDYCRKIMKVAALFKNLKIYFDFKHESTFYMDPASSLYTNGVVYLGGSIFIGAKKLLDDQRKFEVFGVLIHELCHLAVSMAFMNPNFDPFPLGESELKTRFTGSVMNQCRNQRNFEGVIDNVFKSYIEKHRSSEMIVTVPQMMMLYFQNEAKLRELENIFGELFEYSKDKVETELDISFPILNILFGDDTIQYENLTEFMKMAILNTQVNFQGEKITLLELIGNDEQILNHLSSENIRRMLIKKETLNIGLICELKLKYGFTERHLVKRNLTEDDNDEEAKTLADICNNFDKSSFLILADYAGTGKTTTFKECTKKLKKTYPKIWVSFIDLRICSNVFERYKNNPVDLDSWTATVNDILHEIIGIKDNFEKEIFIQLMSEKRVILLLDGSDEINPKYNELLERLLNDLKVRLQCPHLWISTRSLYADTLTRILGTFAYKFSIFENKDVISFVLDILIKSNLKESQDVLMDEAEKISEYIKKFSYASQNVKNIDNPLMIQIITEICIDPLMQIDITDQQNISKLYNAMVKKQKNELGQKVSNEDCDLRLKLTIWDVHKILALILIIGNDYMEKLGYDIDQLSIMRKWGKSKKKWKNEVIQRYGFVTANIDNREIQPNTINFTHRTYAEFFVAEYIVEQLLDFDEDIKDEEVVRRFKLLDVVLSDRWNLEIVQQFVFSYLEMEFDDAKKSGEDGIEISANFKIILKDKIDIIHNNLERCDSLSIDGHYKCFEDYAKIVKFDVELSKQLWGINPIKDILQCILPWYDKLKIQSYTGHDNNFTKVIQLIEETSGLGQNWHESLNIHGQQLITNEEIDELKDENGSILEDERKLLKLCDFVDKNFEHDKRKMCYNIIDLHSLQNNKIIKNLIERIRTINDSELFLKRMSRLDYNKISTEVIKFTLDEIESILGHDNATIRKFLFEDSHEYDSPIIKAIGSDNIDIFRIVRDFYKKYAISNEEIKNVLEKQELSYDLNNESSHCEINDFIQKVKLL